jgi:hypothetical protein
VNSGFSKSGQFLATIRSVVCWQSAAWVRAPCRGTGFKPKLPSNVFNGKIWWSFYEADAGFEQFLTAAVAYFENKRTDVVAKLSLFERERRFLDHLSSGEHVVVLDGAERLLLAYSGLDYAHLDDDELDRATANLLPAGALSGDSAGARRLRRSIDPHVDSFLRKLVGVQSSKVLITSRFVSGRPPRHRDETLAWGLGRGVGRARSR